MKIIIVNGTAKSGKSSFVDFIEIEKGRYITTASHVSLPKEIMMQYFGWDGITKTEKVRKCLSDLKDLMIDYDDLLFKNLVSDITFMKENSGVTAFFIFVREPEQIKRFKDKYKDDCITVLLRRDVDSIPNNHADKNVEEYEYDYIIDNNQTLEDLKESAMLFCKEIGI